MFYQYPSQISCGVHQLFIGEHEPEKFVASIFEKMNYVGIPEAVIRKDVLIPQGWLPSRVAFFVFSDTEKRGRGRKCAAYIREHNLGTLTTTKAARNPNSGNLIRVWTWCPHWKKLAVWKAAYERGDL